jgi:hypothetical protein
LKVLEKLFFIRFFNMLSYSSIYVVVPVVIFDGAKSPVLAGVAFFIEGLMRTALALWSAKIYSKMGSSVGLDFAESIRMLGLSVIACAALVLSLPMMIVGSVLYQFGFSIVAIEQELRAAQQAPSAIKGQACFRLAEVIAMAPVCAVALLMETGSAQFGGLLAIAMIATALNLAFNKRWYRDNPKNIEVFANVNTTDGIRYIVSKPLLWQGLLLCVISFACFVWVLSAGPFLLEGRLLFGYSLKETDGVAIFKGLMAISGGVGSILWAILLSRKDSTTGRNAAIVVSLLPPLILAFSSTVQNDVLSVALLSAMMVCTTGALTWQRAFRQTESSPKMLPSVTTIALAVDCLGMCLAGLALIWESTLATGVLMSVASLMLVYPAWKRNADDSASRSGNAVDDVSQTPSQRGSMPEIADSTRELPPESMGDIASIDLNRSIVR